MASRDEFIKDSLKRSNYHRQNHGVLDLTLNKELCRVAQNWAEQLTRGSSLKHNQNAKYKGSKVGENIAYSFNSAKDPSGTEMIDQWYKEREKYNFNNHGFSSGTGHFTQLVWKDSKEVGFGLAVNKGAYYLVANYYPAGNFMGEFDKNVFLFGSKGCVGNTPSEYGDRGNNSNNSFFENNRIRPCNVDNDLFNDFGSRFNTNNTNNNTNNTLNNTNEDDTSTSTTVETRVTNGMKITTTTTVKKTPQGTSTQVSTRKEYI